MDWNELRLVIGLLVAVATFFIGRMTAAKQDGREMGKLEAKIDAITVKMAETKNDGREMAKLEVKLDSMNQTMFRIEKGTDGASQTAREALDLARRCNTRIDAFERHFPHINTKDHHKS